ncbi:MAG: beta-lactamase family protein [Flavobacteriaceae bacterium]|nr:beta-lactamase family protein [Flavobacteriaceae bacterium]
MRKNRMVYALYSLAFLLLCCKQPTNKEELVLADTSLAEKHRKSEDIANLVQEYTNIQGFNGSVLVAQKGEILHKGGYGYANIEWEVPNTEEGKYQIGSITKSFTAMLVLQLVAQNRVTLQSPISDFIPAWKQKPVGQATIHELLTHTSGLARDIPFEEGQYYSPEQLVDTILEQPIHQAQIGHFGYSNMGYVLLGYLLEYMYKQPYEKVLEYELFEALEMKATSYSPSNKLQAKMTNGYHKSWGNYYAVNKANMSKAYAAGGIISSVEDLYTWSSRWHKILPKGLVAAYTKAHIADEKTGGFYAYGLEVIPRTIGNTQEKINTIGHTGVIDGYCGLLVKVPEWDVTIVLLNNTSRAYLNSMTKGILGILNGSGYDFPRKPLAMHMEKVIASSGVKAGIGFYKKHQHDKQYYTDEQELIVAGYRLLNQADAKGAAAVFALAIEMYPEQDNPYDSYAEAMLALDKTEEAIKYYKISLNKNPNNANAKKMLEKIEIKC